MYIYRHKVQYYETDQMGIVHHSNYIRWMEEARIEYLNELGWEYRKMEDAGIVSPVTAIEGKYKHSAKFAETVGIMAAITSFNGIRLRLRYEMRSASNELLFTGTSEHCFTADDGHIINMKKEYPQAYASIAAAIEAPESKSGKNIR